MHPSNRDHKDMQKRGVLNISSEGGGQVGLGCGVWGIGMVGWGHKIKRTRLEGRPGYHLMGERTDKVKVSHLKWGSLILHFSKYKIRPRGEKFNEISASAV